MTRLARYARVALVLVSCVGALVLGLLAWALTAARLTWLQRIGIAAIGAGGGSNLIDRLRFDGAVVLLISSRART